MMMRRRMAVLAAFALGGGILTTIPAVAAVTDGDCEADSTTETVADGLTLTWDSSISCTGVEPSDSFSLTVSVSGPDGTLTGLDLALTSPRPGGCQPLASATGSGLPLDIGTSSSFGIGGTYHLVDTDEGPRVNLHARVTGVHDGEEFTLGVNLHFSGDTASDDPFGSCTPPGDDEGETGPPTFGDWAPGDGPPPWADGSDEGETGPPTFGDWAPGDGPPPWADGSDEGETGPPAWADGTDDELEDGPPFGTAGSDWMPGDAGPPPWADGTDDEPEQGPPFGTDSSWTAGSEGPPPWADGSDQEGDAGPPIGRPGG